MQVLHTYWVYWGIALSNALHVVHKKSAEAVTEPGGAALQTITTKADIFSMGIVLWEIAAGARPKPFAVCSNGLDAVQDWAVRCFLDHCVGCLLNAYDS